MKMYRRYEPYELMLRLALSEYRDVARSLKDVDVDEALAGEVEAIIHTANMLLNQSAELKKTIAEFRLKQADAKQLQAELKARHSG